MLISPAYAQAAGGFDPSTLMQSGILPLILVFVVFYFLLIRPQSKRAADHKKMLEAVRRGDRIVTNGGLVGLVTKVLEQDAQLEIEIADGVRVRVLRSMISSVLSKTEPVSDKAEEKKG